MILKNKTLAVLQLDKTCTIVDCNQKACEFIGLAIHNIMGRSVSDFLELDCKNGSFLAEEGKYYFSRFHNKSASVSNVVIMVNSVVKQKKHFHYLTLFDVSSSETNSGTGRCENINLLIGHIAHDFNNIFTGVLGSLSILKEGKLNEKQRAELLDVAEHAAKRARNLTAKMHSFARGEITPLAPAEKKTEKKHRFPLLELENHNGSILFLGANQMVSETTIGMLFSLGYSVDVTSDGKAALKKYKASMKTAEPYKLVIMNLTIPQGMGGAEAIQSLLEIDPDAVVIISSGFTSSDVMINFSSYGFKAALPKPYTVRELFQTIEAALG